MKHPLSSFVLACLFSFFAIPAIAQLQEPTQPVNIIIDSDMSSDVDDVGDHAVLWGLVNRGEANVLAIIASSANDNSAPAMRAIANYYGHPDVPIGAHKGATPTNENSAWSPYTLGVTNRFGTSGDTRFNYPDAVTVYRQALANAPDHSVYIVACGFYQPLQALLQSQPDTISPFAGTQLVSQKVRRLVLSAGQYPYGSEHNFRVDPDAAKYVVTNWPGEVVGVGVDVGGDVFTGPSPSSDPNVDPVKFAFNLYGVTTDGAWGQASLLFAIRGGIGSTFSVDGYNGEITIESSTDSAPGFDIWFQTPNAGHSYVNKLISANAMAAILNPLLQSSSNMPILRSISPTSVLASSSGQTVTLNGTNFFQDSQVLFNGISRPTTFVSSTQITAQLSAGDLSQAGNQAISVLNSSEGNWTSNTINLTVSAATPTLSSISPAAATAGSGPVTLTATGSSFMSGSVLQVNGAARSTTFISSTQLSTILTTADLAAAGALSITVSTPGGGTSSALNFTVNNPAPTLSVISPTSAIAGGSGFTLALGGSNFVAGSIVQVNGSNRATTFGSAVQLTATIPASDIANSGYLSITVFNPAPGGGSSTGLTLTVNNPVPSISSVSPNPALAVASTYTVTVSGAGFVRGSIIQIDGAPRTTTYVSSTQVKAQVNGGLLSLGVHTVTVFNPTPGGGTSNSVNLTVVSILGELMTPGLEQSTLAAEPESFFTVAT